MLINYRCQCGTECSEEELITACTFHATREEPAEYEAFCPSGCGTNADDMEEVTSDHAA